MPWEAAAKLKREKTVPAKREEVLQQQLEAAVSAGDLASTQRLLREKRESSARPSGTRGQRRKRVSMWQELNG